MEALEPDEDDSDMNTKPSGPSPLLGSIRNSEDSLRVSPLVKPVQNGTKTPRSDRSSFVLDLPSESPEQIALAALRYLPTPILVLSPFKTVLLANEAMGRLLCLSNGHEASTTQCGCPPTSGVHETYGRTLSQVGVDLIQNDVPVWVDWESFLDTIGQDSESHVQTSGEKTPTLKPDPHAVPSNDISKLDHTSVSDVAVDVILSPERCVYPEKKRGSKKIGSMPGTAATMIISTWWAQGVKYFTLSFVSTPTRQPMTDVKPPVRFGPRNQTVIDSPNSVSSVSSGRRSQASSSPSSSLSSPSPYIPTFPPAGPANKSGRSTSASILQKATRLRETLLNAMTLPCYALWKDQTVGIPNEALMKLCSHDAGVTAASEFLAGFIVWDEHFTRRLEYDEFPIIRTLKSEQPTGAVRVSLKDPKTGAPRVYDCNAECICDPETFEFLGAVGILKDVTEYVDRLAAQKDMTQKQFEYISNHIPPMVWTATPDGNVDWLSDRWYEYTGLKPEQSLGGAWTTPFHPDDMPATSHRWSHSLATGDEYVTEYRCRRRDGEWRWFLGRARPTIDDIGKIEGWFGTCTDIHDAVEARENARRTREQLLKVIETAKLTLCSVDIEGRITFLEGSKRWRSDDDVINTDDIIGTNLFQAKGRLMTEEHMLQYQRPLRSILEGRSTDETCEFTAPNGRQFRHIYRPLKRSLRDGGVEGDAVLDGAIIVSTDMTRIRKREDELKVQGKENARLAANALAAKEASRLKSSFLANMSHEIRTPIAGVIGMAELLADMDLNEDQAECAENILRSANGLLTVINDILDFSKVESGRLDVEEVQFSLSVVIHDVNKMLSFAALRKNLAYDPVVEPRVAGDLRVIGDPGRLRQILTNVLTNSIKFTSEGAVSLAAKVRKESAEIIEVEFTVTDTGIGIEEEIRKKLFTPFSQADSSTARRFGGTGLGLTISKNLVDLMHGSIRLDSKLGAGTKCIFSIPFRKAEDIPDASPLVNLEAIPDRLQSDLSVSVSSDDRAGQMTSPVIPNGRRASLAPNLSHPNASVNMTSPLSTQQKSQEDLTLTEEDRKNTHILVVEDNPTNQQIALKTIKKLGFSVNAVWNGQEAIEYALKEHSASHPRPDIILMDVQMPILDGYKATQSIRRQKQEPDLTVVPIVAMTASAIQGDKEKCMKAGMDDYLAKVSNILS